ncbi:response regulator [Formosa haliotis]|uniref:response regulator n=1 Tax=Formosa haliotis TaxID=1555194 RepID=UPI00082694C8|nr:response regulator [Formosa haliotis]
MFQKVIIADDLGSINQGVLTILNRLGIEHVEQVQYCDDALLKLKKARADQEPFDLLITDLSFKPDHRIQKLKSGDELAQAVRDENIPIKIIVYSVEDRAQRANNLLEHVKVNGYVCKGRSGLTELQSAIVSVYEDVTYVSTSIEHALDQTSFVEINDFDIILVSFLSEGLSQEEISKKLKTRNLKPNSLSSIEKRLNRLKVHFNANNAIHLVAITKDLGLI